MITIILLTRVICMLKICMLGETKYQFFIKKRENVGIKNLNDPSAFIEYSNTMDDVYNNIDD